MYNNFYTRFLPIRRLALPAMAVLFCLALESVSEAIEVRLASGAKMKFDAVEVKTGRLVCKLPEGVIYLTPDQLSREERARYFGGDASAPSEMSVAVEKPAAPANVSPAPVVKPVSLDPAPFKPASPPAAPSTVSPIKQKGGFFYSFSQLPKIHRKSPDVDYNFRMDQEKFYIYVPKNYDGTKEFGLVALIHSRDVAEIPWGWDSVVSEKNLLFIAPQNIGDDDTEGRRVGLTVVAIHKMLEEYRIDPARVYVAGHDEGGRMAGRLAFQHPELVRGCISCSGAEFFKAVKWGGSNYGVFPHLPSMVATAKRHVRFALITGETDAHRDEIMDLYYGGYVKEGFQAKLFNVPNSPQGLFSPNVLTHALTFLETTTARQ